jgi:hypothetical protein
MALPASLTRDLPHQYTPISGHCRKTNHTTPAVINRKSVEAYPVLSLAALRKLAAWYAAYHSTRQRVQPGADVDLGQSPHLQRFAVSHSRLLRSECQGLLKEVLKFRHQEMA